jgi:hypothetical protein
LDELAEAGWPAAMLVVLPMPEPLSATVAGLLLALLVTVRVPVRDPAAVGVNLTVTVQDPPTATLAQLLVWLKSPVTATPETVAALVPELVTVTVWVAALDPTTVPAKDRLPGAAFSTGPGAMPVPDRLTVLVTPPALTVRVPVRVPVAVGEKETLTVHEPFAAIDEPQLLVCEKSPLVAMDETDAAALVGLATVTVCAAVVVPVAAEPKLSALGVVFTPVTG